MQNADGTLRDGKRKRGASGWWWPATTRSPGGTTSSTSRNRPSWPTRSRKNYYSDCSNPIIDTDIKHCELWASLSLVANKENQGQGGPLHSGVHGQDAGALQVRGGGDGQRDDGEQSEMEYLPLGEVKDKDNVSVSEIDNVSERDNVSVSARNDSARMGQSDTEQRERVCDGGGGGDGDGQQGVDDDDRGENKGPGGGHGLLVVTGKRRGRPMKGIVPESLVQLWIQNVIKKSHIVI